MECGRKFKTVKAAERASWNGCPRCGGVDIDLDVSPTKKHKPSRAMRNALGEDLAAGVSSLLNDFGKEERQ
jgi:hypothetical protein